MAKKAAAVASSVPPKLQGKSVYLGGNFYGTVDRWKALIPAEGGTIVDELTDQVDYLLLGHSATANPQKKATKLNAQGAAIQVVSQADFEQQIRPTSDEAEAMLKGGEIERWNRLFDDDLHMHRRSGRTIGSGSCRHADLHGTKLAGAKLIGFDCCDFKGADLSRCLIVFTQCDLSDAKIDGVGMMRLMECEGLNLDFRGISEGRMNIDKSNLSGGRFAGIRFHANFADCRLDGADFAKVDDGPASFESRARWWAPTSPERISKAATSQDVRSERSQGRRRQLADGQVRRRQGRRCRFHRGDVRRRRARRRRLLQGERLRPSAEPDEGNRRPRRHRFPDGSDESGARQHYPGGHPRQRRRLAHRAGLSALDAVSRSGGRLVPLEPVAAEVAGRHLGDAGDEMARRDPPSRQPRRPRDQAGDCRQGSQAPRPESVVRALRHRSADGGGPQEGGPVDQGEEDRDGRGVGRRPQVGQEGSRTLERRLRGEFEAHRQGLRHRSRRSEAGRPQAESCRVEGCRLQRRRPVEVQPPEQPIPRRQLRRMPT